MAEGRRGDGQSLIVRAERADRLTRLETAGIHERRPHSTDARRVTYRLTEKGLDLAPVLVELVLWAARHEETEAPAAILREMTHHRERFLSKLRKDWASSRQEK